MPPPRPRSLIHWPDDPPPDPGTDLFRVLAHPARRAVVEFLSEGEAEAGQIADALWDRFHLMTPAASNHLRVLREAGVVAYTAVDTYRVYALRRDGLAALCRWVEAYGRASSPSPRPWRLQRPDPMC